MTHDGLSYYLGSARAQIVSVCYCFLRSEAYKESS